MRHLMIFLPLVGLGCKSENGLQAWPDVPALPATQSDTDTDTDSDTDADTDADTDSDTDADTDSDTDADTDSDTGNDADTDTDWELHDEPPPTLDDCTDGIIVPWSGGTMVVIAGQGSVLSSIEVPTEGYYALYEPAAAESGAGQSNESAFLRISSLANPTGLPVFANCNDDWVVLDPDNAGPPTGIQYMGTFYLGAGTNTVEAIHFCDVWSPGVCDDLQQPGSSSCASSSVNSVHFESPTTCLIPLN